MKSWRILTVLLLGLVLTGSVACSPSADEGTAEQSTKVVVGDLSVTVSGSGNIEVSEDVNLAFGVGGKIDKIYVEEGDEVSKGDVLAKLETDDLKLALTEAQVAQAKAEIAVIQAEEGVSQAEVAVTQAQLALQTAKYELGQAREFYTWSDVSAAEGEVNDAEDYLESALSKLAQAPPGTESEDSWQKAVFYAQKRLNAAKNRLDAMLSGSDTEEVAVKQLQVDVAEQSLELAEQSLEVAKQSPQLAKQSLDLVKQSVAQAQRQLDKATITAPFDGKVAGIYADEGDIVPPSSMGSKTIIYLIDTESMQLEIQVDEVDVAGVKVGQRAEIEVDALPAATLEGKVSAISLLSTMEGGVIVYDVTVDFDVVEDIGLRVGMSATADIIIAERENVLLVPDRSVKQDDEGNTIVEVIIDGQIEERAVVTGISDGFNTEIVSGLEEGEVVVGRR